MHSQYGKSDAASRALYQQAGRWLKDLRTDAGLTQQQIAKALGYDYYTTISQIERGLTRVPPKDLGKWASLLKMPVADFARQLLSYYDPHMFEALFGHKEKQHHARHR
jgi:transcriptional regulator with XRE-family HTH domain